MIESIKPPPGFALLKPYAEEEVKFLMRSLELPDEESLARAFEAELSLPPGDIIVEKRHGDGKKYPFVFKRVVDEIDCFHNPGLWPRYARLRLENKKEFDLINVPSSDLSEAETMARLHSCVFRWSNSSTHGPRMAFRLIATP